MGRKVFRRQVERSLLKFSREPLNVEKTIEIEDFDAISIFVHSKVDGQTIKAIPKLKLVTTRSTGFDHIEIEVCKKQGITVCNVPPKARTPLPNTLLL